MKPRDVKSASTHIARTLIVLLVMLLIVPQVMAQSTDRILKAYQDRFRDAATMESKLQILQSADMLTVEQLGPLYEQGLQYVLSNSIELPFEIQLQNIALFTVGKIGEGKYTEANGPLWNFFIEFNDNTARMDTLSVLSVVGTGDAELILDLNGWVQAQVNLYRGGVAPDQQVLRAAVATLGELADASSFPVLLDLQLAQISDPITDTGRESMKALPGDYVETAIDSINMRAMADRLPALDYFLDDPDLGPGEQSRIAAGVLAEAVNEVIRDVTELERQRQLRYRAVQVLINAPNPSITNSLIRHFNMTFQDYDRGLVSKTWVLEAIAALGSDGSEGAAIRLTAFLDLLNTYTDNDRPYDTQIMLAVVTNLERVGSMIAYNEALVDALFYVTLLDYPQRVKEAAKAALDAVSQ